MSDQTAKLSVRIRKPLKQFTLDVAFETSGGVLGILGASGCGKSMTLKSIAGIETPAEGSIVLNSGTREEQVLYDSEKRINEKPQRRNAGYLFQNYALFPNMTVAENILAGLGGKDPGGVVRTMAERFHLEGLEDRYPSRLSGGQQQRAALARIFAYSPGILLLDEPFSALDTFLREELRTEFKPVLREHCGPTILVTHDFDEAAQLCDELLLMHNGRIVDAGPAQEILKNRDAVRSAILEGKRIRG